MRTDPSQRGVAIILALIFSILLYVLVAELVVSGRMVRFTGENDVLVARMQKHMDYTFHEVESMLLTDMAGGAAQAGGEGGSGSPLGSALQGQGATGGEGANGGANGAGAPGGEGETDPAAGCDSSRDEWAKPQAFSDGDITTYTFLEPENQKLNLLALWSPDQEFAKKAHDMIVRAIDALRQDSEFDVNFSDAERIVRDIEEWAKRADTDSIPRPRLKTDPERGQEQTIMLHLDELLMLPSVTEDLFYDKVFDGKVYLGLESILTVWTSLGLDPGNPEKVQRQQAKAQAEGKTGTTPTAGGTTPGGTTGNTGNAGTTGGTNNQAAGKDPNAPPAQPEGEGIRVNLNFAPRAVLRAILPIDRLPDSVIDAIVKHRNEVDEDQATKDQENPIDTSAYGDLRLGQDQKKKFFAEVSDLDQLPEFANFPDQQAKTEFTSMLTTHSDVFSVHMASLFKRSEENHKFVLRRTRSIVMRRDNGSDGYLHPVILMEERHGLRLQPVDLQDDYVDRGLVYNEMDGFAQEERAWNPFLIDFYLSKQQRAEFYQRRR